MGGVRGGDQQQAALVDPVVGGVDAADDAVDDLGFHAIDRFLGYILLGAAIVVPAFILLRIANYRK